MGTSPFALTNPRPSSGKRPGTATAPSDHFSILFQIRTSTMGVHPLDLAIGVHPQLRPDRVSRRGRR